jgi:hypothetical protein
MSNSSQGRFLEFVGATTDESYESLAVRDEAILDAYDKGEESLRSIGMRHAITGEAVRLIAQRAGREPRSVVDQRRRDAAIEQAYVELKEGGLPDLKLIAESHQTTVPRVRGRDPQLIGRIAERRNDLRVQARESRLAGEGFRECRICHKTKPMNEFVIGGRQGQLDRIRICKVCNRQRASDWHVANYGRYPEPVTEKVCVKCGEVKPADQFWRRTSDRTGLGSRCKDCLRK